MQKNLRPLNFKEYIGQNKIKSTLKIIIHSAKKRKATVDNILLFGPSGIGKTSLANVIANESESNIFIVQAPSIEKKADLLSIVGSLKKKDIVFIDEIHSLPSNIEEMLYSLIDERTIDIRVGSDEDTKLVRITVPDFTLIGATTKMNKISKPLHSRFGIVFKLKKYEKNDIAKIVHNSARSLKIKIDKEAIEEIVNHSLQNPRKANNILKRSLDFAVYEEQKEISRKIVKKTLESIGIYKYGLDELQLEYLKLLGNNFYESYASIDSISSIMKEEKNNVEQNIESTLIELGFINKNSRGRSLTTKGVEYLNTYNLDNV